MQTQSGRSVSPKSDESAVSQVRLKDTKRLKTMNVHGRRFSLKQETISRKQLLSFHFLRDVGISFLDIKLMYKWHRKDSSSL